MPLTGAISAGSYQSLQLKRGIGWLKFKGVQAVAGTLAGLVLPQLPKIAPLELLQDKAVFVPVPLHARKLRQRGFNQSEDIARAVSWQTGIQVHNVLVRRRSTFSQAKLPNELRRRNIDNAFALSIPAFSLLSSFRWIILVDDVTTSGSTLAAAASVLPRLAGQQIWGLTIARG